MVYSCVPVRYSNVLVQLLLERTGTYWCRPQQEQTMSDKDRVARWRQRMRDEGKEPVTLWLSHEEKQRLEDLAHTGRCSTSEIASQALAHFKPERPEGTGNVTDTEQLRD